jgi:LysR family hydrogen peroxide-inducible transcriptional activator
LFSLSQLQYIVAVARYGNFGAAAKSCFVTQPTLSMQIQKLEEHLGVEIFDRSIHPIALTPIGQKVIEQSRLVLAEADRITALIEEERNEVRGEVRLAVIPTLAPYTLPILLPHIQRVYPQLNLHIEEARTSDIIAMLKSNELDVGLLATPLAEKSIIEHSIFLEPFYVYAEKNSSLAKLKAVTESDLKGESVLLLAEGHCLREQILRVCRLRKVGPQDSLDFASGSIETLARLVERGMGYTIVPHLALPSLQQTSSASIIPFEKPWPSREVSLVVHRSFARTNIVRAIAKLITDHLPADLLSLQGGLKAIRPV